MPPTQAETVRTTLAALIAQARIAAANTSGHTSDGLSKLADMLQDDLADLDWHIAEDEAVSLDQAEAVSLAAWKAESAFQAGEWSRRV